VASNPIFLIQLQELTRPVPAARIAPPDHINRLNLG
jgi:hypothetical protein